MRLQHLHRPGVCLLYTSFEEEFDIEIPDDAAEHIQTVGDAVKFIDERLGA